MNISIFGLGYVGCVSLGCLAKNGHNLIGVDIQQNKIDLINQGKPTIIEKDIDSIIDETHRAGLIRATTDYNDAILNSEVSIIAVGTPSTKEGHLNLEYIYRVAERIGSALKKKTEFHVIAIRSTVIPGTNRKVCEIIANQSEKKLNIDFTVVSNPEFLREGSAVNDYNNPSVTVIGTDNKMAADIVSSLYKNLPAPIRIVNIEIAELIKYVNNSWHALKVTFANEIGNICKRIGLDSHEIMDLFVMDNQLNLSSYYLKPGFAYGGSCLPKDLKGLRTIAHDHYLKTPILENIENSNQNQKEIAIRLIESKKKRKLGIVGLSFKAGTDDLRYSPIIEVAEYFLGKGYTLKIYDKNVNLSLLTGTNKEFIETHIPHLADFVSEDLQTVVKQSDIVIINHKIDQLEEYIASYPETLFIDLVKVTAKKFDNYEGICW